MGKRLSPFDQKLARIRELRDQGDAAGAVELGACLADPAPFLAGFAAEAIGALAFEACVPALAEALLRIVRGEQADTGCQASEKIAEALVHLDADQPDAFRAAFTYVRMERSGPGLVDRAIPVRIQCAMGLARGVSRGALLDLTPLLADPEPEVREGAARAIAVLHGEGPAAVLRLKLLSGDTTPTVLGACMAGLLALDPARHLPVVEAELQGPLAELAALALGESRLPEAIPVLKRALDAGADDKQASLLLLALALLRLPDALAIVFEALERGPVRLAVHAVHALAIHRHTEEIAARTRAAVAQRTSAALIDAFRAAFGE